jgi:hypothetical protein
MDRRAAFAALTLAALAAAADKKEWKTGHMADVQVTPGYIEIGAVSTQVRNQQVLLSGEFLYTVDKVHAGSVWTNVSACRFIVGDDVKYRQDKAKMHLIDTDGKECIGEIVRQERVFASAPRP